jgi:hypothetical protein
MPRRNRKMRGGDISGLWTSITSKVGDAYESAKNKFTGSPDGSTYTSTAPSTYTPTTPSTYTPPPAAPGYGGKRRRTQKKMRGGFSPNTPTTGLAFNASPISGIASAKSMWVGGKTRKRRSHKHSKSCKHRKSRKY